MRSASGAWAGGAAAGSAAKKSSDGMMVPI